MMAPLVPPNRLAIRAESHGAANDPEGNVIDLFRINKRLRQRLESFPAVAGTIRSADPDLLEFARSLRDAMSGRPHDFGTALAPSSEREIVLRAYCAAVPGYRGSAAEIFTCPDEPVSVTLRKIARLISTGTFERIVDPRNPKQFRVALSKHAFDQVERWLRVARRWVR
jgi:hypothetical protein